MDSPKESDASNSCTFSMLGNLFLVLAVSTAGDEFSALHSSGLPLAIVHYGIVLAAGAVCFTFFLIAYKRLNAKAAQLAARSFRPQFSLADLLLIPFFIALVLTVHKACWPKSLTNWGMPLAFLFGLYLLHCQLLAARRGCTHYGLKFAYGAGIFLANLGWLAAFVLMILIECALLNPGGRIAGLLLSLLYMGDCDGGECIGDKGPLMPFRLALIGFPIGLAINQYVERSVLAIRSNEK